MRQQLVLQAPWQLVDGWVLLRSQHHSFTAAPIPAAVIAVCCIVFSLCFPLAVAKEN
jgi:hypothetical protein